jgi:release factor glutamine methyltransferase
MSGHTGLIVTWDDHEVDNNWSADALADGQLEAGVAAFEPSLALYGEGDDALGHDRRILAAAPALLADDGAVLLEIGTDQGAAATRLATADLPRVSLERDLDGHDRVVVLQR